MNVNKSWKPVTDIRGMLSTALLTDSEAEAEVESGDEGSYTSEDIERCYSLSDCETDASRNA